MDNIVKLNDYKNKMKKPKLLYLDADVFFNEDTKTYSIDLGIDNIADEEHANNISNMLQCFIMLMNQNLLENFK